MMPCFEEYELDNALNFTKSRYGFLLNEEAFKSIKKRILNLINNEAFIALISKGEVYKEQPYMFNGNRKQIDIMVEREDKIIVIDYKSSYLTRTSHIEQVAGYKTDIEAIRKKSVEGYLCYLHENKTEIISL
jgi:exodeoxyribonuclease V beta subunit